MFTYVLYIYIICYAESGTYGAQSTVQGNDTAQISAPGTYKCKFLCICVCITVL